MTPKRSAKLSRVVKKGREIDPRATLQERWTASPLYIPLIPLVRRVK